MKLIAFRKEIILNAVQTFKKKRLLKVGME